MIGWRIPSKGVSAWLWRWVGLPILRLFFNARIATICNRCGEEIAPSNVANHWLYFRHEAINKEK